MFIENKFKKWYDEIIVRAKTRRLEGYGETHHIIPSALGGSNVASNKVKLTAREHFICHRLLVLFTKDEWKDKMIHAQVMMLVENPRQTRYTPASRVYERLREQHSEMMKRKMKGENNPFYGKKHTEETKAYLSKKRKERVEQGVIEGMMGKTHSEKTKQKVSKGVENYFKELTPEERSERYRTPKDKLKACEKCGKTFFPSNFQKHIMKCVHGKSKKWFHCSITGKTLFAYEGEEPKGYIKGRGKLK